MLRLVVVVSVGYCLPILSGGDNFVLVLVSSTVSEVVPLSVDSELIEVLTAELVEVFTSSFASVEVLAVEVVEVLFFTSEVFDCLIVLQLTNPINPIRSIKISFFILVFVKFFFIQFF